MTLQRILSQNAFCALCGLPHDSLFGSSGDDVPCTQGHDCAASFEPNGSKGSAHYGSGYDTYTFATAPGREAELAGLDPVCDACLTQAMLSGRIVDISEDGYYAHDKTNVGNHEKALARKRAAMASNFADEALRNNP